MVFSASNVTSFMQYQASPYHFFSRQLIFLIGSLIISFFVLKFNTKAYGYISWIIIIILIGLLITAYCTFMKKGTGFKSYILLFVVIGLISVLILLQPDLGTASIYVMIVFLMFMSLNISKKVKRNIILSVLGLGILVIVLLSISVMIFGVLCIYNSAVLFLKNNPFLFYLMHIFLQP